MTSKLAAVRCWPERVLAGRRDNASASNFSRTMSAFKEAEVLPQPGPVGDLVIQCAQLGNVIIVALWHTLVLVSIVNFQPLRRNTLTSIGPFCLPPGRWQNAACPENVCVS